MRCALLKHFHYVIESRKGLTPGVSHPERPAQRKARAKAHLFELLEEVVAQSNGTQYLRRKAKLNLTLLEQKEVPRAGDNAQTD